MLNRTFGCILLVVGTSIGGGMLALPVATAAAGFWKGALLIIFAWLFMTIGSLLVLEVNLWLPANRNFSTMAKVTLGRPGQILSWLSYGLILYSVLCAYTAGGSDLLDSLLAMLSLHSPGWLNDIIYIFILGAVVWYGTRFVDYANRAFMLVKLGSLILLLFFITPHTQPHLIVDGKIKALFPAVMVAATSFTYSIIVPSIRTYLASNVKLIRRAIIIGSIIPLVCYIAWIFAIQSTIPTYGNHGLLAIKANGHVVGLLTTAISHITRSPWVSTLAHLFTAICMFTTFLAASLALSDFIADAIKLPKLGWRKWVIYGSTFLPVLLILLIYPTIFIAGIRLAGVFCVVIVMILPAAMAWVGRYRKGLATDAPYRVMGGKPLLVLEFCLGIALIILNFTT